VVESSSESNKEARPLGSKSNQEQKMDFDKEFGEKDVKDEVANTSNDN
jgi:hypothetical protein